MNPDLKISIYSILLSFALSVIICPFLIPYLSKLKFGQQVRDDGPQSHLKKTGTPTMGGIAIILAFVITSLFFVKNNPEALLIVFSTLGFGLVGFADDYIKIVKKRSMGLSAKQKILGQIIITLIFFYFFEFHLDISKDLIIPFTKGKTFSLGFLYYPFLLIVFLAIVNAVNLTDGLDGLATGVTLLIAMFFMMVTWAISSNISNVLGAAIGSMLGFLLFNAHPARVFMGDTGSLALGGLIASTSILLGMPLFILIVGIIYVIETLSVAIQVLYFKASGGKRVFKMAPFHHHLELSGWSETKVVTLFYIITALMCLLGYLAL